MTGFDLASKTEIVVNTDGRVQRQLVPEGVAATVFRNVLSAVEVFWNSEGRMPTPHEAHNIWPNVSLKTYQTVYATDEFTQALEKRGIAGGTGLTELQMAAITLLSNPVDQRSTTAKLKDLGVPQGQYAAWMRNPLFASHIRKRAEQNLGDAIPVFVNRLIGNAEAGDQRAIEFGLKMSGRYDPQAVEVENARVVVLTLVEAIMAEIQDAEVRDRILGRAEAKMRAIQVLESLKEIN